MFLCNNGGKFSGCDARFIQFLNFKYTHNIWGYSIGIPVSYPGIFVF